MNVLISAGSASLPYAANGGFGARILDRPMPAFGCRTKPLARSALSLVVASRPRPASRERQLQAIWCARLVGARWSPNAREANDPFGIDRPIAEMLTVEQSAGAGLLATKQ
jgi:hypothetical protein